MNRRHNPDPDEDDFDDDELPDGVYHDDADEPSTLPCPYCREPVYEGAQYCPRCENYLSKEDTPGERKPTWIWILLIVTLLASIMTAFL